jgi:mannose-6-phosphate isomerase
MKNDIKYIEKPWGSEIIWAHTPHYVGKILNVMAGHSLSIQYHHHKDETMYVMSGIGMINFYSMEEDGMVSIKNVYHVASGYSIHIPPRQIHNVEAVTNLVVLEASTDHLDDLVRLSDRYNRK